MNTRVHKKLVPVKLPLADRLRDSVAWLERDGFATSAGLAREAAAELDRLCDVIKAMNTQKENPMTKINELTQPEDLSEIGQKFFFKDAIYMVAEEEAGKEKGVCGCTGCEAEDDEHLCEQLPMCGGKDSLFTTNVIFIKVT